MRTVWKFPLEITDQQVIEVHGIPRVVLVAIQNGTPCIWMEMDTDERKVPMRLYIVGTGHSVPPFTQHVVSFLDGRFVWHIYSPVATGTAGRVLNAIR
jgi:hypothetical protein